MDANQAALMQMRIRNNAGDLQDYLKGLDNWEEDMKKKDASLSKQKPILKEVSCWSINTNGSISSSTDRVSYFPSILGCGCNNFGLGIVCMNSNSYLLLRWRF